MPVMAGAIFLLMLPAALRVPLPRNRLGSLSRNSTASCSPVEAPEGTAARPRVPSARRTSASTVGLPRESRISRPMTLIISIFLFWGSELGLVHRQRGFSQNLTIRQVPQRTRRLFQRITLRLRRLDGALLVQVGQRFVRLLQIIRMRLRVW